MPSLLLPPRTAKLKQVWVSYQSCSTTNRLAQGQEGGRAAECWELQHCPLGQRTIPPVGPSGQKASEGPPSKSDAEAQSHAADNTSASHTEAFLRGVSQLPLLAPRPIAPATSQSQRETPRHKVSRSESHHTTLGGKLSPKLIKAEIKNKKKKEELRSSENILSSFSN